MRINGWIIAGLVVASAALVIEQPSARAKDAPANAPTTQPAPAANSADSVMKNLDAKIEANPVIEPARRSTGEGAPDAPTVGGRATLDPAVLGAAPGMAQPKLHREGEFVVNRLGRLVHGSGANQLMFAFEADAKNAPEPPMILLPCQILENMEEHVQERGDNIVFKLSGQITTYHGANYVLPTMMKLDNDKGNLQK